MVCQNQTHSSPSVKLELINQLSHCTPVLIEGSMIGEMIASLPAAGTDILFGNERTPTDTATRIPNTFQCTDAAITYRIEGLGLKKERFPAEKTSSREKQLQYVAC